MTAEPSPASPTPHRWPGVSRIAAAPDPAHHDLVAGGTGTPLLESFNRAGILAPVDVHFAVRLGRLAGEADEAVLLAAALAIRAPRAAHVAVDLATVRDSVVPDRAVIDGEVAGELDRLDWPEPKAWAAAVEASPLVARGPDAESRPVRLDGGLIYLERYWRDEVSVAADLLARAEAAGATTYQQGEASPVVAELFGASPDQCRAAEVALAGGLTVIAGGPGTGKTTTVARILALLGRLSPPGRPPLVALAAPTGKAAARLEEAVHAEAQKVGASWLQRARGTTLHRLLGTRPGRAGTFRHGRSLRLPHDVVVVDEASMAPLSVVARLLEAVRSDARLIFVGDPDQLASVEAGAVLADVVGPAGREAGEAAAPAALRVAAGARAGASERFSPGRSLAGRVAVLRDNHRFSGALARLAEAVRRGDSGATIAVLSGGEATVRWHPCDGDARAAPPEVEAALDRWAGGVVSAARGGDAELATARLAERRVLCAHREGPGGLQEWNRLIESLAASAHPEVRVEGEWYAGRPVLVGANDYVLRLFNGDTGVVVATAAPDRPLAVAFPGPEGATRLVSPHRLARVDTVFATTVHKSQGSEFDEVIVVLPDVSSRLLTRELLYTAVTRARRGLTLIASEEAVLAAVGRRATRASGLSGRLWPKITGGSEPEPNAGAAPER